jgi:predicted nucleic acid-binding protein
MLYLDTDILVYSIVNQDEKKLYSSQQLIKDLKRESKLLLSPLSLQELTFTLSKLNVEASIIHDTYSFFREFCQYQIDRVLLDDAFQLCQKLRYYRNINDTIHLKFAERYSDELVTYDSDFKRFQDKSKIKIRILK